MSGETAHQLPANRSPPTPMIQTPVVSSTSSGVPPVFPTVEPVPCEATELPASPEAATLLATGAASSQATTSSTPGSAVAAGGATGAVANHVDHARTVSQSSASSSTVPELVAVNSAIINN